ncbi:monofunctional biosynthetic peptidoglycan transglycosylase [bacterium BMS3Abin03]|nr:monofunctional biosynthetic peptidoglycan transglycosylase [bacterium BMS3Abin03]
MKKKLKNILKKIGSAIFKIVLILIAVSFFQVVLLKWIDPFTSSIMLQRQLSTFFSDRGKINYRWIDYRNISKQVALAVVASEDQNFPYHIGFDFEQINKALKENKKRRHMRGASTITQQVAKNLFLWEGQSFLRKGIEAYYTVLIEFFWSKERILEMYLNISEMGMGVFGVGAASIIYFKKLPNRLTKSEGALIAAVLPNPVRYSIKYPSNYIRSRQFWIMRQMDLLGGVSYIKDL